MSIELVILSNHLILCCPLLPALSLSQHQGLFQWVGFSHQVSKLLDLQLQSFQWLFRVDFLYDWLLDLAVQGTLKSLIQHDRSRASILWRSALFMVQFSHSYTTTGKTIALTRRSFVSKVMSLLFNMQSRLVIAFLPRCKRLLISWLQSPICSDFGAQENKVSYCFHCFPIYLPWSDGARCHNLSFYNIEF